MSKNKVTSKTDNKDKNSLEENINIDPDTNTGEVNVDENGDDDISIEQTVENQNKQIKELKDQLLRSLAESENLRKRTVKEIADAKKYSHIYFIRDLVSSVDNLQRALEAVPEDKSELSEPIKNLVIGLEIVEKEMFSERNCWKREVFGNKLLKKNCFWKEIIVFIFQPLIRQ